jgi:hypothetical protein
VSVDPYLEQMRGDAESLMLDTFTAYAATTQRVDGLNQTVWVEQYETPGKIAGRSRDSDTDGRTVRVGGVDRLVVEGGLHLPMSIDPLDLPKVGWQFECSAVGPASDPSLLGRRWEVVDVPAKSYATARRLDVVEVTE